MIMQILSDTIFHNYSGRIKSFQATHNSIVLLTDEELTTLYIEPNKKKQSIKVNTNHVVRVQAGNNNLISMLLKDSTLQIRKLNKLDEVIGKFSQIGYNKETEHPKIKWEKQQIYLLYESSLELINLAKKERKVFSQIVNPGEKIQNLALSNIITKEKIAILQLHNKLIFSLIPIPITDVFLNGINQILSLSHPLYGKDALLDKEYLLVVLENSVLHIYNIINMKLLVRLQYDNPKKHRMKVSTDAFNEYLIISFSDEGTVTRNILYKINEKYYSQVLQSSDQDCFFDFEIELGIKEEIGLYTHNHGKDVLIQMYYTNKTDKQIRVASTVISKNFKNKISTKMEMDKKWKEVREWKEMISSIVEMRNSLEKLNFQLNELQNNKEHQPLALKGEEKKTSSYDLTEDEKEIRKFEIIRDSLQEATREFQQNQLHHILPQSSNIDAAHEKKVEEEFYKFMRQYFKQKQVDFDPELLDLQIQTQQKKKKSQFIQIEDEDNIEIVVPLNRQKTSASMKNEKNVTQEKTQEKNQLDEEIKENKLEHEEEEQCQFTKQLKLIQKSINAGFTPLEQRVAQLDERVAKYQNLHVRQLQKCAKLVEKERKNSQNVNSFVHAYCKQMMIQFNEGMELCMKSFWGKIEEMDRRGCNEREKTIDAFGKYIDQQIKNRQCVFDSNRLTIDNHLSHLRKKMVETFIEEEDDEIWEEEEKQIPDNFFTFYQSKI